MKRLKKILLTIFIIFIVLNILLQIGLSVSKSGLNLYDVYTLKIPKKDNIETNHPDKFIIKKTSSFDSQGLNQCAAFSSAYLLRINDIEATGLGIYNKMNHKFANGYVLPQAIIEILRENKIEAKIYKGNFDQLKTRLKESNKPIIVLIGESTLWQHYVSLVGYDKNNVYLYDSLKSNSANKRYNRKMSNDDFNKYWKNGLPLYENIYYIIE